MAKGRPRKFDPELAIGQAMHVFWKKGYDGTTLDDLTEATGVSRPSLYAAFGNKEALFLKVLDRYRESPASYLKSALEMPTARQVFEELLNGAINLQTDPINPLGCLFVHGALTSNELNEPMQRELASRRASGERAIRERFQKAADEGDLPSGSDPADLARYAATMLHGMAVQAIGGDTRVQLLRVAKLDLIAFPDSKK
jgi:AcrR family transcriptional regulator